MSIFKPGDTIKSLSGAPIRIVKFLNDGGQGEVYQVEYKGQKKALKWYFPDSIRNPRLFINNLLHEVIEKPSPDKAFLWPEALTSNTRGSFGYIMDLVPDGYYTLEKVLATTEHRFSSYKIAVEACLKILSAFRILHNRGYSYQDLNFGNFFVNPSTGDVLIGDNDNVAPNNTPTGILGTPRFMAPEVVTGKHLPNTASDRFSLSVIIFFVLMLGHPLEGNRWTIGCLTDEHAEWLYGKAPLFIFDPKDKGNAPDKQKQKGVIEMWSLIPDYLKQAFMHAFSQDLLFHPDRRMIEVEWMEILARLKNEIFFCSCGNNVFLRDNKSKSTCECCGKVIKIQNSIQLPHYAMPAIGGSEILRCQLGTCDPNIALTRVARLIADEKQPDMVVFQNLTPNILPAKTPRGADARVNPNDMVPIRPGISVKLFDKTIQFM